MGLLLKIGQMVWRICEFLCGKVFFLDSPYLSSYHRLKSRLRDIGMHMYVDYEHYRESSTYPSHRSPLSFEFISEQYFQGYPHISLSLSVSLERTLSVRLQEFKCGFYATFMTEIKSASWADLVTLTNILVDTLDIKPLKPRLKREKKRKVETAVLSAFLEGSVASRRCLPWLSWIQRGVLRYALFTRCIKLFSRISHFHAYIQLNARRRMHLVALGNTSEKGFTSQQFFYYRMIFLLQYVLSRLKNIYLL